MRKKIIAIGIIILILGMVFYGISDYVIMQNTETNHSWQIYKNGEFISKELNFTTEYVLTYSYNQTMSGVVNVSSLESLNLSNLKNLSIKPLTVTDNLISYELEQGNYYIVIFSSSLPNVSYTYMVKQIDRFIYL